MKPRIGIAGGGVVGSAIARAYSDDGFAEVGTWDIVPERRTHGIDELVRNTDLIFVCLPTPQLQGSLACDVSIVEKFFASVAGLKNNFVLRSTVPIGTTRRLATEYELPNLVHSPEFLTARTAVHDARHPRLNVIGAVAGKPSETDGALFKLYQQRFPLVDMALLTSDESEGMKLAMNSFFAVKVAFWNETYQLFKALGVNYSEVIEAIVAEGRVGELHTEVPGPDGKLGFGGACLPKDLASFVHQLNAQNVEHHVAIGALTRNLNDRDRGP